MRLPWGINVKQVYVAFFALLSVALCAFSLAIYNQYAREQTINDFTVYQYEAMRQSRLILGDVVDMETGVRGFIITGDQTFLDPYTKANGRLRDEIFELRTVTYSEPDTFAETNRWLDKIETLQTSLESQIALVKAHGRGAVSAADLDKQKAQMDSLRGMLETSMDKRMAKVKERARAALAQKNSFIYILVLRTIIGVVVLCAATLLILKLHERFERAEGDRDRAETRFMTVMSGINDGLYDLNFVNDTMYMSKEFKAMLGYEEDEVPSTGKAAQALIHPDDQEQALDVRREYILKHTPHYRNVFRMKHKDGSWRWMLSRGVGSWDKFGNIRSIVGTHTDITEQKNREEELRELHADMEAFTYITSHDMRSPLVNLKGFSHELALSVEDVTTLIEPHKKKIGADAFARIEALLKGDIPESLGFIGNAVDRMDTLTSAILDLSRIGKYTYRYAPVSAQAVFDKCLGAQSYEISSKGVVVSVEPLPEIVTDAVALEQVFSNLLDNAVKYLRPETPGRIEVACRETARDYVFSIRDNGRGIEAEDAERVFNIFRRARNTGDVRGLGLGMAFVKATLRKMSGAIWFESVLGSGTTFYVSLPRLVATDDGSAAS